MSKIGFYFDPTKIKYGVANYGPIFIDGVEVKRGRNEANAAFQGQYFDELVKKGAIEFDEAPEEQASAETVKTPAKKALKNAPAE